MAMLTPEDVARKLLDLYEDDYNDSLDTVEAKWSTIEPVTLDDFAQRSITADPASVEVMTSYPALAIAVGDMTEVEGTSQLQRYASLYDLEVTLAYYLKALDPHTLGVMLMRHMEATLDFLGNHPRLDQGNEVSIRGVRLEPSANVLVSGGNVLVKGLRVQFSVRLMQYGV